MKKPIGAKTLTEHLQLGIARKVQDIIVASLRVNPDGFLRRGDLAEFIDKAEFFKKAD